jgi:T5SS/PEP-CTERM-associated repeat protein
MRLPHRDSRFAAAGRHRIGLLALAMAGLSTAVHAEDAIWRLVDSCQNQDFSALNCWSSPSPAQPLGNSTRVLIQASDLNGLLTTVNFANQGAPLLTIASMELTGYSFGEAALSKAVLNVARGTLNVTGDTAVGKGGNGTINQSGGDFKTANLTLGLSPDPYSGLSSFNLSGGSLTVQGKVVLGYVALAGAEHSDGQFRQSDGSLKVGSVSGPGTFIYDGGTFDLGTSISVGSFVMGRVSLLAPATFTLTGSQRSLKADALTVGESFEGVLKVTDQAQMTTQSTLLGSTRSNVGLFTVTGNGRVEVTGAGSTWTNTQDLILGGTAAADVGTGALLISDNGQVATGGKLQLWSKGSVVVDKAALSAGSLTGVAGSSIAFEGGQITLGGTGLDNFKGAFAWTAGKLVLPSAGLSVGPGTALGPALTLDLGKAFSGSGAVTVLANGSLTLAGGRIGSSDIVNNGALTIVQIQGPWTLVTGRLIAASGSSTTFDNGLSTGLAGPVFLQPGALVNVHGNSQVYFSGPVVEMTGSHVVGPGFASFEGGLAIEAGQGPLSAAHSLGHALHDGPVGFGDLNIADFDLGADGAADLLTVNGALSFAGTLRLTALAGYVAKSGDHFQLFSFTSSSGYFTSIDTSGLAWSPDLALDTSHLYIDGTIGVQAVPEPAQWLLLLCGLAGLRAAKRLRSA